MSEGKARSQSERFRDLESIIRVIDIAYECGIRSFMFSTHDRVREICDYFRNHQEKYPDMLLYPAMPYAHKYANAVAEKGILGALNEFLLADRSTGQLLSTLFRGGKSVVNRDMIEVMKLLVDAEMMMFRNLSIGTVFLQNIVTDLLLGMRVSEVFVEFSNHIKKRYGVDAGFITMNMPELVDILTDCGIENPIVCSSINKIGYLMFPDRETYEQTIQKKKFRPVAMSVLASGAVEPLEGIEYVCGLERVNSIIFGASSRVHIEETYKIINRLWPSNE